MSGEKTFQDGVREYARVVLTDVLGWRTTGQRWSRIADLVAAVERAFAAADLAALDEATANLELAVPVRNNRIERSPEERRGIDDDLRERVNRLQHSLGAADKEDPDDRSDGGDR